MFPVLFCPAAEFAAPEGEDGVCALDGPPHAGLFEPSPGDCLAAEPPAAITRR